MKQGVMWNRLKKPHLNLKPMLCDLEIFETVKKKKYFSYGWVMGMHGQG
jgi:hypothetical protein